MWPILRNYRRRVNDVTLYEQVENRPKTDRNEVVILKDKGLRGIQAGKFGHELTNIASPHYAPQIGPKSQYCHM